MSGPVFITGLSGFVGRHLARHCAEQGDQVVGLLRSESDRPKFSREVRDSVRTVNADLRNQSRLSTVVGKTEPSRVYHLAALSHVPRSIEKPRKTYQVNFKGTLNLLEALEENNLIPSVLLAGSASQYGETAYSAETLSEEDPLAPTTPYGVSKVAMEKLGGQWAHSREWDIVTTRSFPHTGPGQRQSFFCSNLSRQIVQVERSERSTLSLGNISVVRDYTDVRDVVRAYRQLLETSSVDPGVYNVCSGEGTVLNEIVEIARDYATASVEIEQESDRERSNEPERIVGDPVKLRDAINWRPDITLEETMADLIDDWRERLA